MSTSAEIRPATLHDLDAIEAVEQGCFGSNGDAFTRPQLAYLIAKAQGACYVAIFNGRIAGYISLLSRRTARNLRIYSVAVSAEARGHGLGQALVKQAVALARHRGVCEVTLEVRTDNTLALGLYARNGFTPGKLLKNYYHDGGDARRMVLRLS